MTPTKSLILAAMLACLTGCYSVPATKISVDPSTHQFIVASPKDVSMSNVTVTVTGCVTNRSLQTVSVNIGWYSSANNFQVVQAVANANIASQKNIIAGLEKILQAAGGAVLP